MAYKFQVGSARLSGSTTFEQALVGESTISSSGQLQGASLDVGAGEVAGTTLSIVGAGSVGSLDANSGGIANAGAIAGATTVSGSGAVSGFSVNTYSLAIGGGNAAIDSAGSATVSEVIIGGGAAVISSNKDITGSSVGVGGNSATAGDLVGTNLVAVGGVLKTSGSVGQIGGQLTGLLKFGDDSGGSQARILRTTTAGEDRVAVVNDNGPIALAGTGVGLRVLSGLSGSGVFHTVGAATFGSSITATGSVNAVSLTASANIVAANFYGDGSGLSSVAAAINVTSSNANVYYELPFVEDLGNDVSLGGSTGLQFNPNTDSNGGVLRLSGSNSGLRMNRLDFTDDMGAYVGIASAGGTDFLQLISSDRELYLGGTGASIAIAGGNMDVQGSISTGDAVIDGTISGSSAAHFVGASTFGSSIAATGSVTAGSAILGSITATGLLSSSAKITCEGNIEAGGQLNATGSMTAGGALSASAVSVGGLGTPNTGDITGINLIANGGVLKTSGSVGEIGGQLTGLLKFGADSGGNKSRIFRTTTEGEDRLVILSGVGPVTLSGSGVGVRILGDLLSSGSADFAGSLTASVNVVAANFYGDGSGLTGVTATPAAAGSDTYIQFNQDSATAGDAGLVYNGSGSAALSGTSGGRQDSQLRLGGLSGDQFLYSQYDSNTSKNTFRMNNEDGSIQLSASGDGQGNGVMFYTDPGSNVQFLTEHGAFNVRSPGNPATATYYLQVSSSGHVSGSGEFEMESLVINTDQAQITETGAATFASLNNSAGGITNAGAIAGATTIAMGGALSGVTTATLSGLFSSSAGAQIVGATILGGTLNVTGASDFFAVIAANGGIDVNGSNFTAGTDGSVTATSLNVQTGAITNVSTISGSNNVQFTDITGSNNVVALGGFFGDGSGITGITPDAITVNAIGDLDVNLVEGLNYASASITQAINYTLPAASTLSNGDVVRVKMAAGVTSANHAAITCSVGAADNIDGEISIVLESPYAAVELYKVAANTFRVL